MENKNIINIINLHTIEKRLFDINNKRGNLPKKISELNKEIENYKMISNENNKRIEEIDKRRILLNGSLGDTDKKISSLNEQMYQVKSNKEYEALLKEIDHLNNENTSNLNELDTFEKEIEEINENSNLNNEKLNSLVDRLSKLEKRLTDANLTIENEEKELIQDQKKCLANSSDKSLLDLYEGKKEEYDGLAFATANSNCCGNCYSSLPAQLIIDINNRSELVTCPSCRILLYLDINEL